MSGVPYGSPNPAGFEEALLIRRKHLLAQAVQLTRDKPSAEDLVQDTFVRALDRRRQFDGVNMGAWLRVIMRSIFINGRMLHANRMEHIPIDYLEPRSPEVGATDGAGGLRPARYAATTPSTPPSQEGVVDLGDNLRRIAGALSPEESAAVLLTYGEGHTYKETAEAMGATLDITRSRIFNGRALLRRLKEMEMDE